MKPHCPVPDCEHETNARRILCDACEALVPREMINEIVSTWALVKQTKKANLQQAVLRRHRLARTRAIQFVIDRQKAKAVPA